MNKLKSIISLIVIVIIPFALMVWYRNHQSSGFASIELIVYPMLFGGLGIAAIYSLKKFFLKENIQDFNSGTGTWKTDLLWGIGLTIVYFILFFVERLSLANVLRFNSNMELLGLMLDMRENPLLLIIWFGPVLWIGIAFYEELLRLFILTNLWKWSENLVWSIVVILISATLIGLAHWSQGSYEIVTIGIKSIVSGFFFFRQRRLMPLVYAHVLYDGLQVGMLLLTYPES